jgi:5,10-methylenetetrahydrofolate reductase
MLALRRWSVRRAHALWRLWRILAARAPRCAPLVRRIGRGRSESLLRPLEHGAKRLFFDCRMCGQCVLSSTGMACPMNCPKRMRNGPCGGVRADGGCEVLPTMRCVWLEALDGRKAIASGGGDAAATRILPPLDHSRRGSSTWLQAICDASSPRTPQERASSTERGIPQPAATVDFEEACRSKRIVVTVEVAPPDSADPAALVRRAAHFDGLVDAINITDGAGGNCHMSSAAAAAILAASGRTPVCQVACRDRNRIAIQGDLLGAAALGVRNVLCLTGDDVSRGDHPQARPVFDLDAVSLLGIARRMSERGEFASGRRIEAMPLLFLGATANPFVPPYRDRVANLEKKIDAGARFVQTQFCFDVAALAEFMREVRARELQRRCTILVGVGTLGSARALRWMAANVPGVHIPEPLLLRIEGAADQKAEARRICLETIDAVLGIDGVRGVHLMGHRNEEVLAGIIVASGLRERPPARAASLKPA